MRPYSFLENISKKIFAIDCIFNFYFYFYSLLFTNYRFLKYPGLKPIKLKIKIMMKIQLNYNCGLRPSDNSVFRNKSALSTKG